jgi:hypothetical protein
VDITTPLKKVSLIANGQVNIECCLCNKQMLCREIKYQIMIGMLSCIMHDKFLIIYPKTAYEDLIKIFKDLENESAA